MRKDWQYLILCCNSRGESQPALFSQNVKPLLQVNITSAETQAQKNKQCNPLNNPSHKPIATGWTCITSDARTSGGFPYQLHVFSQIRLLSQFLSPQNLMASCYLTEKWPNDLHTMRYTDFRLDLWYLTPLCPVQILIQSLDKCVTWFMVVFSAPSGYHYELL